MMKAKKIINLISGILACLAISHLAYAEMNPDEMKFIQLMDNVTAYTDSHQDDVWPGFHLGSTPLVVVFEDVENEQIFEHIYALNLTPGKLPWQKIQVNNHAAYYLDDNIIDPNLSNADGSMYEIEGQNSYVDAEFTHSVMVSQNFYNKLTILRAYMYVQSEAKIEPTHKGNLSTAYDGFYQPEQVKLLYLEDAALTASLQDKGDQAETELQDAVAIHQYRQNLMSPEFKEFEHATEIFTGLPFYISWKSLNLSDDDYIKKTQLSGCKPFSIKVGMSGIINCSAGAFEVFSTTTYGRALEQHLSSTAWKSSVETAFKSPARLMQVYYQMSDATAQILAEAAMNKPRYNYSRIVRTVNTIVPPFVKELTKIQDQYNGQPGVELYAPWELNYIATLVGGMFGLNDSYVINTNTGLGTNMHDISVYNEGETLKAEYKDLSHAYTRLAFDNVYQLDERNSWSVMKLSSKTKMRVDGMEDTVGNFVNSGKVVQFHDLIIDDEHFTFTIKGLAGTLDGSDGTLKIKDVQTLQIRPEQMNGYDLFALMTGTSLVSPAIKTADGHGMKLFGLTARARSK